ncbi:kinesin-like protein Nod [Drosophila ficusphila]|uniref:kinesin-like protein Nod n=1 Tax=Drosophila ficusphila TaxID=30025 RepID=UPI0007E653DA|nr:kinesin-like protein Nod [Drosophila ficusphila]
MDGEKLSAVRIAVREAPYRQFLGRREPSVVEFPPWSDGKSLIVEQNEFHFDHAFPSTAGQNEMYQALILPLVEKAMQGFPCTALAYGQTGTGKSYSMGMAPQDKVLNPEHLGVLPRCLDDILSRVTADQENNKGTVRVFASFIEIYNEKAYDLLGTTPHVPMVASRVQNCRYLPLNSQLDLQKLLQLGTGNRRVRPTNMNASSSRSHAIVTIHIKSKDHHSRLNIVDLAGSEGVGRTGNEGVARKEGVNINLGLLSINKVIMSMAAGRTVIPYRDSVLTTVLQESLSAQSYLTFLACISPHLCDLSETLSTLRFGTSAKKLRLNPMQVARQKHLLAARTPHTFRRVLSSSTAIKRQAANQSSPVVPDPKPGLGKPTPNMLKRTRSDMGMTPKAKKRAREVLQMEDTTMELSSIHFSDSNLSSVALQGKTDQKLMPPPFARPVIQTTCLNSTAMAIPEKEPVEPAQPTTSARLRCQLFNAEVSVRPSTTEQELSGIEPIQEALEPRPNTSRPVRRSTRLASFQKTESEGNLRRSVRLAIKREASIASFVKAEQTLQMSQVGAVPQTSVQEEAESGGSRQVNLEAQDWMENHIRSFFNTLNTGSLRDLQKFPGIGPKTAFALTIHRSRLNGFQNLDQVKGLPIWPGKSWDRFCQLNCLN